MTKPYDVVIIGGGPGGSTTASFLRKYAPQLSVLVLERERFPRDHIGESQLPPISAVLDEIGAWNRVEAAGFPIKIGATFTWGRTVEPWVFEFLPVREVPATIERPGRFEGWRRQAAFQVDRAKYDEILLDYAAELGAEVREATPVKAIRHTNGRVDGVELADGSVVTARHYVDASGNAAILRRALGIEVEVPTPLKNVAFWDYWENPAWEDAGDRVATRIHIRSIGYGWLWYIPLSSTRTSIGLVCNGDYYKSLNRPYQELYHEALQLDPYVSKQIAGARSRKQVEATTDWSFVVKKTYGENWFLVGECAGFADPILSAGMTLTHTGARELAYTIVALERGGHDRHWLLESYDTIQRRRVRQHMRFAEFWYSANGIFDEVRENCVKIAEESGFSLNPTSAFQWLGKGGLGDDAPGQVGIGACDLASVRQLIQLFTGGKTKWLIDGKSTFRLNLAGAKDAWDIKYEEGQVHRVPCWIKGNRRLPRIGVQAVVIAALEKHSDAEKIMQYLHTTFSETLEPAHVDVAISHAMQVLELLADNFWIQCETKKDRPTLAVSTPEEGNIIHLERAGTPAAPAPKGQKPAG